jgi:uncharacterized protein YndB with AHSA1/START domain
MTVTQAPSDTSALVLRCPLPAVTPAQAYAYWTDPALLCAWWPPTAELDPRPGGGYHLRWPSMGWHLFGRFTAAEPGRLLAFTWAWEHEPDNPPTSVRLDFQPGEPSGALLTLRHQPFDASPASQKMRADHLDGWLYFLPRLQAVASGTLPVDG